MSRLDGPLVGPKTKVFENMAIFGIFGVRFDAVTNTRFRSFQSFLDAFSDSLDSILKLVVLFPLNKVIVEKRKKMHFLGVFSGYFGKLAT